MFELCDNLIGIYKTYNTTKSITIDPRIYDNVQTTSTNNNVCNTDNQPNCENPNINEENEKEAHTEQNGVNNNLELSKSISSVEENDTIRESSSNQTGSLNINDSEDMDMFSADSQSQSDKEIQPLFTPEQMEVDS